MNKLLKINNLIVSFENPVGELTAVKGVSLSLDKGETLALVGESGCGKTVLCKSMLKILCDKGRIRQGEILLADNDLVPLTEEEMQARRGGEISMIFQDPMTSLDPAFSVGDQIAEVLRIHKGMDKDALKVAEIYCTQSRVYNKKLNVRGRGRADVIVKRGSHITVILDQVQA